MSPSYGQYNSLWRDNVEKWNMQQDYLTALKGFQLALHPTMKLWNGVMESFKTDVMERPMGDDTEAASLSPWELNLSFQLAQRLLFCAYCEADGNHIQLSRERLVQCISILFQCDSHKEQDATKPPFPTSTLQDAFMELMLSYEEVAESRTLARHVAHLAIQCSDNGSCMWKNPLQRPGYMVILEREASQVSAVYVPREEHPDWCAIMEANWKGVADELSRLQTSTDRNSWGMVGSGDRGSGGDDHRVVSAGGWTEYVLFGTGSSSTDSDAPFTKSLLRRHVGTSVSLAEAGGGEVIFSRLAPHTHIEAHCGPTNLRWTAHLGLVVPTNGRCQIRVGREWHSWQVGKILLFDDSFEHEVVNDTGEERTVLLIRLWHPGLSVRKREEALSDARFQKELAVEKRFRPPS